MLLHALWTQRVRYALRRDVGVDFVVLFLNYTHIFSFLPVSRQRLVEILGSTALHKQDNNAALRSEVSLLLAYTESLQDTKEFGTFTY